MGLLAPLFKQILLLGLLVFNTLDRIGGGSLNLQPADWLVTLVCHASQYT